MAKATRSKTASINLPVPQSRDEAASAIARIGALRRDVARARADLNDEIAARKEAVEAAVAPAAEEIVALTEGLAVWAGANRAKLTGNGKSKTADLGTGLILWRQRPPSVTIRGMDAVIGTLRDLGYEQFVRVKEEVNREAMLADPETARTVPGVSIGSPGEDFIVEPFEVALAAEGGAS